MNKYTQIDVSYLRPSRTIETILLENGQKQRIVYVYNYEGIHYRVFHFIIDLMKFFYSDFETEVSFETDEEMNDYLENLDIASISIGSDMLDGFS